jgi:DHA2 family multidrug resistance protein
MSNATGLYTLVRQLGGSLGIAILQFLETRRQDSAYATLASGVTLANQNVAKVMHANGDQVGFLNNVFGTVMLNAETVAYNDVFRICALVFLIAVPSVLLMRPPSGAGAAAPAVVE